MKSESHSQIASLRAELQARSAALDAAYKELDLLCYAVSHDLRAPLRAIDGFTRMLLDRAQGRLDDEDRRLLDVVRGNAGKMSALIEDLVRYSRLNRQAMHPARVDMAALAAEAFNALHAGANVRLQLQTLPEAWGDLALLKQVWSELLANALKFSARNEAPRVVVSAERRDAEQVFRVSDNGVGFDMAYAKKLFAVFQRLHAPRDFPGNGIGLANVARIVQRHGGRVGAEGTPGQGATFWFALPVQPPSPGRTT
jgi:light-regulated signal transduction histidine kinase (bacteriophytochrome)